MNAVVEAIDTEISEIEDAIAAKHKQLDHYQQLRRVAEGIAAEGEVEVQTFPTPVTAVVEPRKVEGPEHVDPPSTPRKGERRTALAIDNIVIDKLRQIGAASVATMTEQTDLKDFQVRACFARLLKSKVVRVLRTEGHTKIHALAAATDAVGAATEDEPPAVEPVTPFNEQPEPEVPVTPKPPPRPVRPGPRASSVQTPTPPVPAQPALDALKADIFEKVKELAPISAYVIHGNFNEPPHKINDCLEQLHQEGKIYRDDVKRWVVEDE